MDREAFLKEYEAYNLDDLNTIYVDQADRFIPEERDLIFELIQKQEHSIVPEPEKSLWWLYLLSFPVFPLGILIMLVTSVSRNRTKQKVVIVMSGSNGGMWGLAGMVAFLIIWAHFF